MTLLLPDVDLDVPDDGLTIGDVSAATGIAVETLRYYEREGLLLRATPRDGGGRRRFFAQDVAWLAGLVMLRETGMGIADIRVIADLSRRPGTEAERLAILVEHRRSIVVQLARTEAHLRAITTKIAAYEAVAAEGDAS